jgi:hypothetical protein
MDSGGHPGLLPPTLPDDFIGQGVHRDGHPGPGALDEVTCNATRIQLTFDVNPVIAGKIQADGLNRFELLDLPGIMLQDHGDVTENLIRICFNVPHF